MKISSLTTGHVSSPHSCVRAHTHNNMNLHCHENLKSHNRSYFFTTLVHTCTHNTNLHCYENFKFYNRSRFFTTLMCTCTHARAHTHTHKSQTLYLHHLSIGKVSNCAESVQVKVHLSYLKLNIKKD